MLTSIEAVPPLRPLLPPGHFAPALRSEGVRSAVRPAH